MIFLKENNIDYLSFLFSDLWPYERPFDEKKIDRINPAKLFDSDSFHSITDTDEVTVKDNKSNTITDITLKSKLHTSFIQ